jgi:ABC-type uncharacterized transport system substrate-binding protein
MVSSNQELPTSTPTPTPGVEIPEETYRVFVVYSYTLLDPWNSQVEDGLLEALNHLGYGHLKNFMSVQTYALNVDEGTPETVLQAKIETVTAAIESVDPDVVIVVDDLAAQALIPEYPDSTQTFVFCGINDINAAYYALLQKNTVGVLEDPFPVETAHLAKAFVPHGQRVLLIGDETEGGEKDLAQLADALRAAESLALEEVVVEETGSWETWQQTVLEQAPRVDFVLLAQYRGIKDSQGELVDQGEVLAWTLRRSTRPVFALWLPAVQQGAVGGMAVSPYEQGWAAAELTVEILEGASPTSLPVRTPQKNELAINIAGGEHLGLQIPMTLLTTASVYKQFPAP